MHMSLFAASSFLLLMGLVWGGSSGQAANREIYRCIGTDGTIMFTDDRDNFPPGCKEAPVPEGRDRLTVIQPAAASELTVPALLRERASRYPIPANRVREWKKSAYRLATEYREAKAERVPTQPPARVHQALERMQEIKKSKRLILQEVANAPVSPTDRREIEAILASIPLP